MIEKIAAIEENAARKKEQAERVCADIKRRTEEQLLEEARADEEALKRELAALRERLQEEAGERDRQEEAETEKALSRLAFLYEKNHEALSEEIADRILKS